MPSTTHRLRLALTALLALTACGTSGPACPVGASRCGGACVDTASDAANCGACGNACGTGLLCSAGACAPDCHPVALDLDTPFSTALPPFASSVGQQAPTSFWGTLPAPRPTNAPWENLVVGPGQNRVDFLPYQIKAVPEGLAVARAAPAFSAGPPPALEVPDVKQLVLGSLAAFTGHVVTAYDALSVTLRYAAPGGTMSAPLVQGMPYVTVEYAGLRPLLSPGTYTLLSVNGATTPGVASGARFELALSDGTTWIVYAAPALAFDWNHGSMTAQGAFAGTLRVADSPSPAAAAVLDAHAGAIPRGGVIDVASACDVATLRFVYTTSGSGPLLTMAMPHHLARLEAPTLAALTYPTLSGTLQAVEGATWTMSLPLTTLGWTAPRSMAPAHLEAVRAALVTPLSGDATFLPDAATVDADPYFGGKQLAKLARLALIADELGETATASTLRNRLAPLVAAWLDGSNGNPLVYDTTWGGVVTTAGLASAGSDFGQGHYNDHHFHYGYHLYAAAALARADPSFAAQHRPGLLALVRDIANPSAADPGFPRFRTMDFFRGHSWAAGLTEFADGQNQESTSEAVNAWYALHLLGLAAGDARMSDLGRVLLALELDAAHAYWQIPTASAVYQDPFAQGRCVGILFQTRAEFNTWFGPNPEYVYGIQLLPFTPVSEALVAPAWMTDAWPRIATTTSSAAPQWAGLLAMGHAVADREAAWTAVSSLGAWDDGNSRTNALWWVASRP
jgi:endo-1,3(4)-beta-glucanase